MKRRHSSSYCMQTSENGTPSDKRGSTSNMKDEVSVNSLLPKPESGLTSNGESVEEPLEIASRAYQLEMFQQSLQQNIIVAMDTGSGKTQIAVLRIRADLEKSQNEKIIWFLAPTVMLCEQQLSTIKLQLPSVSMRMLTGNDKVDTWDKKSWDVILNGTRLIVSTYQVLLDALDHAFVSMRQLSLIIFDEAHNCVGKHPGGKIMNHFYHKQGLDSAGETYRPAILGLTATPSMKAQVKGLEKLEALLDARCISPTVHREELLQHVKQPDLHALRYEKSDATQRTPTMISLFEKYFGLDITKDPYILHLQSNPTERSQRELERATVKHDTFSINQIKGLCSRSVEILQQLGPWASDYYIWKAKETFLNRVETGSEFFDGWINDEKRYVARILREISAPEPSAHPVDSSSFSDKVSILLKELLSFQGSAVGIIFVKERATAAVLAALLSSLPQIREKYSIGAVVGTSNYASRRSTLYESFDSKDVQTLQKFRMGKINLLVATAVLEEGIDVPACNLVMCFDTPATSKSFVQRRGRARMSGSKLFLFTEGTESAIDQWSALERAMMELCRDEERERVYLETLEDSEEVRPLSFIVETTGARLDMDNAKQHLEHFCKVLSQGEFIDNRPDYIVDESDDGSGTLLRARLILPSFLPVALRQAQSAFTWRSEKNATKDAAFQAYVALYKAGLVNDNLLPYKLEEIVTVETRAPIVDVDSVVRPWQGVAKAWKNLGPITLYEVGYYNATGGLIQNYKLLIPAELGNLRPLKIHADVDIFYEVRFSAPSRLNFVDGQSLPDCTTALLSLHFGHRWQVQSTQHVIKITSKDPTLILDGIGSQPFDLAKADDTAKNYLVRDAYRAPYTFLEVLSSKPDITMIQRPFKDYEIASADEPYLNLGKWSKRTDFLHKMHGDPVTQAQRTKPYSYALPLSQVTADTVHIDHACFGRLLPSIIHEIEVMLVARELTTTLLYGLELTDLLLVREAISARSAEEPMHYERLEFLGDSILKYCTAVQASADHTEWPEGYLSLFRDRLVANSRLSRAALETGLSKYILTVPFTGQKWRPLYVDDILEDTIRRDTDRKLSTKVLADVVESLIGASYIVGGTLKAVQCISIFIKDCQWRSIVDSRSILYDNALNDCALSPMLQPLEVLLGYSFKKKSLLIEACTHASFIADMGRRSMERLEFLGDAVLDNVIVTRLFSHGPPLPHHAMHMIKTAMVNKDFLAFIALEEHDLQETEAYVDANGSPCERSKTGALWRFMRHASMPIGLVQATVSDSHQALRNEILTAISEGTHYPWALLARLQAKKFYCDIFEALLGAVWIDSGSIDECKSIVSRFGITSYLERILRDNVHVQHPKEELGKLALSETVNYKMEIKADDAGEKEYSCQVLVGERLVAEVDGGLNKEEVKTKAATEAVRILTMEASRSQCAHLGDD